MATTEHPSTSIYARLHYLAPHGDALNREPFTVWYPRVKAHLSNVPADVAEHWIHRHWGQSPFDYLPLEAMHFTEMQWTQEELAEVRFSHLWGNTSAWHDGLVKDPEDLGSNWLFHHMASTGTWPAAIIVLDNAQGLIEPMFNLPLPRLVLVEGHRRLEYIRALSSMGKARMRHAVWLAKIPGAVVARP